MNADYITIGLIGVAIGWIANRAWMLYRWHEGIWIQRDREQRYKRMRIKQ